ncbi:MAG: DNA gyrase inhibitor YacG [Planctomycetaceae bacterium]
MPFCSRRCRQVDFFRWWDGRYACGESSGHAALPSPQGPRAPA